MPLLRLAADCVPGVPDGDRRGGAARRGRPRVYCSARCRKRHGHAVARQRARESGGMLSVDELAALLGGQFPDEFLIAGSRQERQVRT